MVNGGLRGVSSFRARLVLEEQRRLHDVWMSAAQGLRMPTRQAFQPRAFGPLLPFVSLVEIPDVGGLKVRVVGSALREVFVADPASALTGGGCEGNAASFADVARTGLPAAGLAHGRCERRGDLVRAWMRLPLGHGDRVECVLGLDIAVSGARAPDWALAMVAGA